MALLDNPAARLVDGRKVVAVAGTPEALSADTRRVVSVLIQAETDNTQPVTVGASTVVGALLTRRGIALAAGATVAFNVAQLTQIFVDALVNGEGVTFVALEA